MHIEILPGTGNVVRFPVERRARATLAHLRELAPDVREVLLIAETFGFETVPFDYRDQVDAETARHIAENAPAPRLAPKALLRDVEAQAVSAAMAAVVTAKDGASRARSARSLLEMAELEGGYALGPLQDRAEFSAREAAALLIEAHGLCEAAEGVARAVRLARAGEVWAPSNSHAETEWLIAAQRAAS